MKLSNIFLAGFISTTFISLIPQNAMAFTLDLFSSTDANDSVQLYLNSTPSGNTTYSGQEVHINQPTPQFGLLYNQTESDSGLSGVVGGSRHLKIATTSGSSETIFKVDTIATALDLSTGSGTHPVATIVWNGASTVNYSNLSSGANLDLDLESGGDNSIGINIFSADQASLFKLTLGDSDSSFTIDKNLNSGAQTVYYDFATYETNGVDVNDVQYIALEVSSTSDLDLRLDLLQTATIPFDFSPSLGLGIVGLFWGGKRIIKKRQAI